jgi:protoheme IX farnesyltransferase
MRTLSLYFPWRDYLTLCKPKVVLLMMITAWIGMLLACPPNQFPLSIFIFATIGISFCASSAAAINQLVEIHIDEKMQRTKFRPLVLGKLSPQQTMRFALALGLIGLAVLIKFVNPLTAWLTLSSLIGYAFVYTLFLKKATPQNIVIGGITGALPPLLGQTAVTGQVEGLGLILALIIFVWTPPHFWALAIFRIEDYKKISLPMLPVTHGIKYTKQCIVLYSILLVVTTFLLPLLSLAGTITTLSLVGLNIGFMYYAIKLYFRPDPMIAWRLFQYSIIYLFGIFVALLIEHYLVFYLNLGHYS